MAESEGVGAVGENRTGAGDADDDADANAVKLDLAAFAVAATIRAGAETDPPLSATQIRVLVVLGATADGATLTEVGNALGSSPPAASQLCRGLFHRGFADRSEGPDPTIQLRLTPSGRDALRGVNASCLAQLDTLCERLSGEERVRVIAAFRDLAGVLTPTI